jgi:hypothetical protein
MKDEKRQKEDTASVWIPPSSFREGIPYNESRIRDGGQTGGWPGNVLEERYSGKES